MPHPAFKFRLPATAALFAGIALTAASTAAIAQARVHASDEVAAPAPAAEPVAELARSLRVGDIVFTRIGAYPFRETVTPASVLHTPGLETVFDGTAA